MYTAFLTASDGAIQIQNGLDIIANNVSNISTAGYKAQEYSFTDILYSNIYNQETLTLGHGTKLSATDTSFERGSLTPTYRNLDYAITTANGFFAVQKNGQITYTRDGNFHLSESNGNFYLTSSTGGYILDANNKPITVDPDIANDTNKHINVGVFSFLNMDGLIRNTDGTFLPTSTSGAAVADTDSSIKNGYLESSNVNIADQLAKLIEIQRAFQMNTRMVQLSDEVVQTINSVR